MSLFAIAVAVGLAAGYARGGRLGRLSQLRLRAPVLVGLALAVQAGAGLVPPGRRFALVIAGYALVGVWLVVNAREHVSAVRAGVGLLALGWLMNIVPIAAHGGMPVSAGALERAGMAADYDVADGHLYKHVPDRRDTPVDWLGDVLPVRPLDAVVSLGDISLMAGIALCLAGAMVPPILKADLPAGGDGNARLRLAAGSHA